MENNLEKFMNNIELINKDLSLYKDSEKGIMFYINTVNLLTRVDYLELDKTQYKIAKFEKKIEDKEYDEITIKRVTPKNVITKRDEDKYTLVDSDVLVHVVWNVSNTAGMLKSFTNKEEALKYAEEINKKVFEKLI